MTFYDEQQSCSWGAQKYFYDPREQYPGYVDGQDMVPWNIDPKVDLRRVDSVMVPPGYKLYLYENQKWQGKFTVIDGAYEEG